MKTSIVGVEDLLSPLSSRGVEKRLARLPGVKRVEVNTVSGSASVHYDESLIDLKTIKSAIVECGHHCSGELVPKHVCEPEDPPGEAVAVAVPAPGVHAAHAHHGVPAGHAQAATVMRAEPAKSAHAAEPAVHAQMDAMAHEMGHGAGHDMQGMASDMRNRFFVALAFSVPIFFYSPMGEMLVRLQPPFGMQLNLFLFILATGAIV